MKVPEWLQPGVVGAACGAAALAIVGFSWAGWTTDATAQDRAEAEARTAVAAALAPVCLERSHADPDRAARMAEIEDAATYQRRTIVMDAGWATMPGAEQADRAVAEACLDRLEADF
jgi:hypothetical protein